MNIDCHWIPGNGGTEKPFTTRTKHMVQWMWNTISGQHAYYCLTTDLFVENNHADLTAHGLIW